MKIKKFLSLVFCFFIASSLAACGGGSPLKKAYDELYQLQPEYKYVLDNYFSFQDEKELKKVLPEFNITGSIMAKYKKGDDVGLQLAASMVQLFEDHLGGFRVNTGEFCKANNGYYYGMFYNEDGNMCYPIFYESKDKNDMIKLSLKEQKK